MYSLEFGELIGRLAPVFSDSKRKVMISALRHYSIAFFLLSFSGFSFLPAGAKSPAAEPARSVFSEPSAALHSISPPVEGSRRGRLARVNPSFLDFLEFGPDLPQQSFRFNLFPGTEPVVRLQQAVVSHKSARIYSGSVEGIAHSRVLLARQGDALAGSLFIPGHGSFQILHHQNNLYEINEPDPMFVPECGVPHGGFRESVDDPEPGLQLPARGQRSVQLGESSGDDAAEFMEEPPVIEVMVVYTSQAREGAGGTDAILAQIHLAMAEANLVMENSGIATRLRLVHAAEISYAETGDLDSDLARLRGTKDGYMDEVHAWREEHRADLVSLFLERSQRYAGLAYLSISAESAFSVVQRRYATTSFIFTHELGHNFGCDHDRQNTTGLGYASHSYGHRFTADGGTYRTVMSYHPGEVIPYFSNPEVLFLGKATGVPPGEFGAADNARTITATSSHLDAYRGHSVTLKVEPGGTIQAGENLTFFAVVESEEGPVERVQFLHDQNLFAEIFEPPYTAVWTNSTPGIHLISARSILKRGLVQKSGSISVAVRPANDDFSNRIHLSGSDIQASTVLYAATGEPGEPAHFGPATCTVWWSWTAPLSGVVRVALSPVNNPFLRVAIYQGDTLSELRLAAKTVSSLRDVHFNAREGETYQIALIGEPSLATVYLGMTLNQPPSNDLFSEATPAKGITAILTGSTVAASREEGEPSIGVAPFGHSIWFAWTAPSNGRLAIWPPSLPSGITSYDFAVFTGEELSDLTMVATSAQARIGFRVESGITYYIGVDGPYAQVRLDLALTLPAANDQFENRIATRAPVGFLEIETFSASREPGEPLHGNSPGGRSLWWSWRSPIQGGLTFSRFTGLTLEDGRLSPNARCHVAIYTGDALDNLVQLASHEFIAGGNDLFGIPVVPEVDYLIVVESEKPIVNPARIWFEVKPVPMNALFAKRFVRTVGWMQRLEGTTLGAGAEPGEPFHSGQPARHSVWWSFHFLQNNGLVAATLETTSSTLPRFAVYRGDDLDNLTLVANNRFGEALGTVVTFEVERGEILHLAVDEDQSSPKYVIDLQYVNSVPRNDDFSERIPLPLVAGPQPSHNSVAVSTVGATREPEEPDHTGTGSGHSVWYFWNTVGPTREITIVGAGQHPAVAARRTGVPASAALPPGPFIAVYQNTFLTNLVLVAKGAESVRFKTQPGTRYQIAIDGLDGHYGHYLLRMLETAPNDHFENAIRLINTLTMISFPLLSMQSATLQPDEPNHAGRSRGNSLWWKWTPEFSGNYSMQTTQLLGPQSTAPSPNYTAAVYTGDSVANLQVVASNVLGSLTFPAHAKTQYYIALDLEDQNRSAAAYSFTPSKTVTFTKNPGFMLPTRRGDNSVRFRINGAPGQNFTLQTSPDLFTWTSLTNVVLMKPDFIFDEWPYLQSDQKFFRLIQGESP
jgi:hypothetical protein